MYSDIKYECPLFFLSSEYREVVTNFKRMGMAAPSYKDFQMIKRSLGAEEQKIGIPKFKMIPDG